MKTKNPVLTILIITTFLFINLGWSDVSAHTPRFEAVENILYVKQDSSGDCLTWATACELQTALGTVIAGTDTEIWVAAGTYKPTTSSERNIRFELRNYVAIYGGFPATGEPTWEQRDWEFNTTILSGDIGIEGDNTDNSYHVVWGEGASEGVGISAVLNGFTVSGGNADGTDEANGGGINNGAGSPTLTNLIFSSNCALGGGGMYNNGGSPTLTNVTFSGNTAGYLGGGMYNYGNSSPTLTNATFSSNATLGDGGGMYNYESSPTLTNVTFSENSASLGGGMYNNESSNLTLTKVTFSENSAESGGGMFNLLNSNFTLTNVTFSENSGNWGVGMFNSYTSPRLTNVTFFGNKVDSGGSVIYNYTSNPTLTNTILWGSTANPFQNDEGSEPIITNSDIQGCGGSAAWNSSCGTDAGGNIDADPLVDLLDDYGGFTQTHALKVNSPAIDAGDPNNCPSTDQRGFYRPIDGNKDGTARCDMGAYEYGSALFTFLPVIVR